MHLTSFSLYWTLQKAAFKILLLGCLARAYDHSHQRIIDLEWWHGFHIKEETPNLERKGAGNVQIV